MPIGRGGSAVQEADREALSALAGKISLTVVSSFRSVEGKATFGSELSAALDYISDEPMQRAYCVVPYCNRWR